jgi:NADPH:quinone reductase-like Zn-dependent oxidoreductase
MFTRRILVLAAQLVAILPPRTAAAAATTPSGSVSYVTAASVLTGYGAFGCSSRSFASSNNNNMATSETKSTTSTAPSGRIVLVSGATGGIGKEIALGAAKQEGVTLLLPVRDLTRGATLASELKTASGNANIHLFKVHT